MKRIGIFITLYTFALLFVKAQENNLQLIFLENNQLTFSEPYPVKYYNLIQKKKVDGIKLFFSDSTKIIPLQNVWGLIYENTSEKETDTFIIDKGLFSSPRTYKLIGGNINENAIFYRSQDLYLIYLYLPLEKYYLTENKKVIPIKTKKQLVNHITNKSVVNELSSSKRSIEWWLQRDNESNEIRLLSLFNKD